MRLPSATWIARGVLGLVFASALVGAVVAYNGGGGGGGGGAGRSAAVAPTQTPQPPERATPTETPSITSTPGPLPPAATPTQAPPAQGPARQPTPARCGTPEQRQAGGRTVQVGRLSLDLPKGRDYDVATVLTDPGGAAFVRICLADSQSVLVLDATDGHEVQRMVTDPQANGVMDAIVASVKSK